MQGRYRFAWLVYLIFGTVAVATYSVIPAVTDAARPATGLIGVSMVLMMALGVYLYRPRAYGAWLLLAAGQLAFALGRILFAYQEHVDHGNRFLSIAGVCYLSGYPLFWAGLALLLRARAPIRNWTAIIDAAAITTSFALASWLFVASPIAHDQTLTSTGRAVSLAYPLGAIILLATALRISMGASKRPPAYWLLGGGIFMLLLADSANLATLRGNSFLGGKAIDLVWLGSYLL
ncbi:MAG TPA: hypothetical protein VII05_03055, partial [Gaiellaceae bacterium]